MTTLIRYPHRAPRADDLRRTITGTPAEVAATVARVRRTGRLVAMTVPRPVGPTDPRVAVVVIVRPTANPAPPRRSRRRWVKPTVITLAAVGTVAGIGYGLIALLHSLARAVATPAALGGAFLLVLALVLIGARGGCPGLHCSGCGRH